MKELVSQIPILGYLAKWLLDLIRLPVVRQDLHDHIVSVEHDATAAKKQLGSIVTNCSRLASSEHDLRQRVAMLEGLPKTIRALKRQSEETERALAALRRASGSLDEHPASAGKRSNDLAGLSQESQAFPVTSSTPASQRSLLNSRLLNPHKLLAMAGNLRLNLGCGEFPLQEYFNIDRRELEGVDMIGDVSELPFQTDSVSEIYAAHLIEHFPERDLIGVVLPAWYRVLRPGGLLRLVTPDAEAMMQAWSQGEFPWTNLRLATFGRQDYSGNFHYTMFSRDTLRELLTNAGFECRPYSAIGRKNGECLEMELTAVKKVAPEES